MQPNGLGIPAELSPTRRLVPGDLRRTHEPGPQRVGLVRAAGRLALRGGDGRTVARLVIQLHMRERPPQPDQRAQRRRRLPVGGVL